MGKRFVRNIEDFKCEHCGAAVKGDGYTNHCPHCLHSKHVDINPGDRASTCRGLMKPIGIEKKGDEFIIILKCVRCNAVKRNKSAKDDSIEMIIQISTTIQ